MLAFFAFIHVLCGVSFLGIMIASFVYIVKGIRQKNHALLHHAIKTSLLGDCILFPIIIIQILTGAFMATAHHIPQGTPWITVAYLLFFVVSVIWFFLVLIKIKNVSAKQFLHKNIFYVLNCVVIILFVLITHDAVTQSTWL